MPGVRRGVHGGVRATAVEAAIILGSKAAKRGSLAAAGEGWSVCFEFNSRPSASRYTVDLRLWKRWSRGHMCRLLLNSCQTFKITEFLQGLEVLSPGSAEQIHSFDKSPWKNSASDFGRLCHICLSSEEPDIGVLRGHFFFFFVLLFILIVFLSHFCRAVFLSDLMFSQSAWHMRWLKTSDCFGSNTSKIFCSFQLLEYPQLSFRYFFRWHSLQPSDDGFRRHRWTPNGHGRLAGVTWNESSSHLAWSRVHVCLFVRSSCCLCGYICMMIKCTADVITGSLLCCIAP